MKAKQVMTKEVIVIPPSTTLAEAQSLMTTEVIRHLPVTEGRRLVGMLSDRDLLREGSAKSGRLVLDARPVSAVMTPAVITASLTTSVSDLAGLMIDHRIDSVPIVGLLGEIVGMVTSTDLLELLRDDDRSHKVIPFDFNVRFEGAAASA